MFPSLYMSACLLLVSPSLRCQDAFIACSVCIVYCNAGILHYLYALCVSHPFTNQVLLSVFYLPLCCVSSFSFVSHLPLLASITHIHTHSYRVYHCQLGHNPLKRTCQYSHSQVDALIMCLWYGGDQGGKTDVVQEEQQLQLWKGRNPDSQRRSSRMRRKKMEEEKRKEDKETAKETPHYCVRCPAIRAAEPTWLWRLSAFVWQYCAAANTIDCCDCQWTTSPLGYTPTDRFPSDSVCDDQPMGDIADTINDICSHHS